MPYAPCNRRPRRSRSRERMSVVNCPNCGARLPEGARFCPDCGVRVPSETDATAVEEVPPDETGRVPVNVAHSAPRYFGVTPPMVVFGLAVASLALAIVVLVLGHLVAGIV